MRLNMNVEAEVEECEYELLGSVGDPVAEKEQGHQHMTWTVYDFSSIRGYNKHADLRLCDR